MSASKLMLVLGGTGFLGRLVVERMLACDYKIRLITRGSDDWQDSSVLELRRKGIDVVIGDATAPGILEKALEGVSAIVNMVGVMKGNDDEIFELLHLDLVERLVELGKSNGVQRFLHVSCLGAQSDMESVYFQTKWESEEIVKDSELYWTIIRPSYMFGNTFPLLSYLKPLISFKLFLPIIGSGTNSVQPVFVEDVADCIVQSIYLRESVGKSYDIVGPDKFSMLNLLERIRKEIGLGGSTMNVPSKLSGRGFDMVARALPRALLTSNIAEIMSTDSYSSSDEMLKAFDVKYVSLEEYLPKIIESIK